MTGYVLATSPCIGCGRIFSYNPHRVPSTSVVTGKREPICQDCIHRFNLLRAERDMPPIEIAPDAYDAIPENEL
jgi:hypothetical protein